MQWGVSLCTTKHWRHSLVSTCSHMARYVLIWRHEQNWKYIMYCNATKEGPSHTHRQHAQKLWKKHWSCSFEDMQANRQTHNSTTRTGHGQSPCTLSILCECHPYWGRVNKTKYKYIWSVHCLETNPINCTCGAEVTVPVTLTVSSVKAKFHYTDTNPTRTGHGQSPRTLSSTS